MLYLAVIILLGHNLIAHHQNEHIEEQSRIKQKSWGLSINFS